MNTLKTLLALAALSAAAYAVYVTLSTPPADVAHSGDHEHEEMGVPAVEEGQPGFQAPVELPPQNSLGLPLPLGGGSQAAAPAGEEEPQFMPPAEPVVPPTSGAGGALSTGEPPQALQGSPLEGGPPLPELPSGSEQRNPTATAFARARQEIQSLLQAGELRPALTKLTNWYDWGRGPTLPPQEQAWTKQLLSQLAGTVIYSRQHMLQPAYEVQPGDSLEQIAERFQVPWALLAKINGIRDPQTLRPGTKLKVVRGPFDAYIELDKFRLTLRLEDMYAGHFPVGIGQDQSTPPGEYVVQLKIENPVYYGPDQIIGKDDPQNPLGEYWIDLGGRLGIHGTNDPGSIGKAESRGCIRLRSADIADLFDILSIGSRVVITGGERAPLPVAERPDFQPSPQ